VGGVTVAALAMPALPIRTAMITAVFLLILIAPLKDSAAFTRHLI
jgi:hypothetical protein